MNPPNARRVKRAAKKAKAPVFDENNLTEMLSKVSEMIKNNPGVVSQINNCMGSLMKDPEMMNKIINPSNPDTID